MIDKRHTRSEALHRALGASNCVKAGLAELDAALNDMFQADLKGGLEDALKDAPPPDAHRRNHRPGCAAILAADPELRAFVEARLGILTFNEIEAAVAEAFPPERHVKRSAIHQWWQRHHKRTMPDGPR